MTENSKDCYFRLIIDFSTELFNVVTINSDKIYEIVYFEAKFDIMNHESNRLFNCQMSFNCQNKQTLHIFNSIEQKKVKIMQYF